MKITPSMERELYLGYEFEKEAAKPKTQVPSDDAPTQTPMKAGHKELRNPTTDQKKVRRAMTRKSAASKNDLMPSRILDRNRAMNSTSALDDIVGYTYQADIYCPEHILAQMTPPGFNSVSSLDTEAALDSLAQAAGIDRYDEASYDSGDFPKIIFRDQAGDDVCGYDGEPLVEGYTTASKTASIVDWRRDVHYPFWYTLADSDAVGGRIEDDFSWSVSEYPSPFSEKVLASGQAESLDEAKAAVESRIATWFGKESSKTAAIKTFDQWNKEETARIAGNEDPSIASNVRKARSGGMARFTLWDDYLDAAQSEGFEPESTSAYGSKTVAEKESSMNTTAAEYGDMAACAICDSDIQWLGDEELHPGIPGLIQGGWTDRGGSRCCDTSGAVKYDEDGIEVPLPHVLHTPYDPEGRFASKESSMHIAADEERTWPCGRCNATVTGVGHGADTQCPKCGAEYNAWGQMLRDDWRDNESNYDDEVDDMSGYENSFHDSSRHTEAEILRAMASKEATPAERRQLQAELNQLRAHKTAAAQARRDIDLTNPIVNVIRPVAVHGLTREASDWIMEDETSFDINALSNKILTEASLWFTRTDADVKADRDEFMEQARGAARRTAGVYGEQANAAERAFMDHVAFLNRKQAEAPYEHECSVCGVQLVPEDFYADATEVPKASDGKYYCPDHDPDNPYSQTNSPELHEGSRRQASSYPADGSWSPTSSGGGSEEYRDNFLPKSYPDGEDDAIREYAKAQGMTDIGADALVGLAHHMGPRATLAEVYDHFKDTAYGSWMGDAHWVNNPQMEASRRQAASAPTCPQCGSAAIQYSKAKQFGGHTTQCRKCGNQFDQDNAYAQASRRQASDVAKKSDDPRYVPGVSENDDDMTDEEWFDAMGPAPKKESAKVANDIRPQDYKTPPGDDQTGDAQSGLPQSELSNQDLNGFDTFVDDAPATQRSSADVIQQAESQGNAGGGSQPASRGAAKQADWNEDEFAFESSAKTANDLPPEATEQANGGTGYGQSSLPDRTVPSTGDTMFPYELPDDGANTATDAADVANVKSPDNGYPQPTASKKVADKPHGDMDRSVAFSILLEVLPGFGSTPDDGGATVSQFLNDWYQDPGTDMYAFAQQWAQGRTASKKTASVWCSSCSAFSKSDDAPKTDGKGHTHTWMDNATNKPKQSSKTAAVDASNALDYMMQWEDGTLDDQGTIDLFQYLVDTGQAWSLQGAYGRQAQALIDGGYITPTLANPWAQDVTDTMNQNFQGSKKTAADETDITVEQARQILQDPSYDAYGLTRIYGVYADSSPYAGQIAAIKSEYYLDRDTYSRIYVVGHDSLMPPITQASKSSKLDAFRKTVQTNLRSKK